jgi:hypothetical protein
MPNTLTAPNNRQIPWPPAGGVEYTVQKKGADGESFTDIAIRNKIVNDSGQVDVWKLISFNFKTTSPSDVNFILKTNFNAKLAYDGINYMFRGKEVIYLPPDADNGEFDLDKVAGDLELEVDDLLRFLNNYSSVNDGIGGLLGIITEFAGMDALGALNTVAGGLLGMGLFYAWWLRLNEQDEIAISLYAACYQYADWVAKDNASFGRNTVESPEFPEIWVQVNFLGVPSNQRVPESKQWKMDQLRQAWERGAEQMRLNLHNSLRQGHHDLCARLRQRGVAKKDQPSFDAFEGIAKLFVLKQYNALKYSTEQTRGLAVALTFYRRLKDQVEKRSNLTIYRTFIPYPSTELDSMQY